MLSQIPNSVIRDNIEGNRLIPTDDTVRRLMDTPEFQRLRYIKQLGLASYVFPTAEHSRFAHSLGVYATAYKAFDHLRLRAHDLLIDIPVIALDQNTRSEFLIAALCHDIGHSAFSHVLETILLPAGLRNHEECTVQLIRGDTKIAAEIRKVTDVDAVTLFIEQRHPNRALTNLISSQFDVDRCDYVLRDSAMAGVKYGQYDLDWLIHSLTLETNDLGLPVLTLDGPRGLDALRQFLSARRYLHRHIYYHATVRSAQILMKAIFERLRDLPAGTIRLDLVPKSLRPFIWGANATLHDFINTTDVEIIFAIKQFAQEHPDEALRHLCGLFLNRRLPKAIVDTGKMHDESMSNFVFFETEDGGGRQGDLFGDARIRITEVVDSLREFVGARYVANGLPSEAVRYLVAQDRVAFSSVPPTDMLFSFGDKILPVERLPRGQHAMTLDAVLELFFISRVFVPADFQAEASEHFRTNFSGARG